ncbi:MAG: HAD-IA family hydrolase [Anaerolineae bacterium]|nr:HAD-IA family hydrolase [Anaerolineae bacterium]
MRFSALIWDMDGTLFDTYPAIRAGVVAAFAEHGVTVDAQRVARLLAVTFNDCLETLAAEHSLDPAVIQATYARLRPEGVPPELCPPFPGVIDLCHRMIAAGGCNLIFTHRERASLDRFLTYHGMTALFADTLTVDEGGARKPDPGGFLTLLTRNGISPEQALAIGDRDLDIEAGQRAGIKTCYFASPEFPGGPLPPAVVPDYTISSYAELAAILFTA